jgi:prophage antirepressor-like protein
MSNSKFANPDEKKVDIFDLKWEGEKIQVFGIGRDIVFDANEVARRLGYTDANRAVRQNIKPKYTITVAAYLEILNKLKATESVNSTGNDNSQRPGETPGLPIISFPAWLPINPVVRTQLEAFVSHPFRNGKCNANNRLNTKLIPRAGVYSLIMQSNLPEAEAFQDWLFEVLETLYNEGTYTMPSAVPTEPVAAKIVEPPNQTFSNLMKLSMKLRFKKGKHFRSSLLRAGRAFHDFVLLQHPKAQCIRKQVVIRDVKGGILEEYPVLHYFEPEWNLIHKFNEEHGDKYYVHTIPLFAFDDEYDDTNKNMTTGVKRESQDVNDIFRTMDGQRFVKKQRKL